MSEQPGQKIYVPRSVLREKKFQSGNSIITMGLQVEETIAFLKKHANSNGYVNLGISTVREVGRFGQTHSLWLDTWEPNRDVPKIMNPVNNSVRQPPVPTAPPPAPPKSQAEDDDLPF